MAQKTSDYSSAVSDSELTLLKTLQSTFGDNPTTDALFHNLVNKSSTTDIITGSNEGNVYNIPPNVLRELVEKMHDRNADSRLESYESIIINSKSTNEKIVSFQFKDKEVAYITNDGSFYGNIAGYSIDEISEILKSATLVNQINQTLEQHITNSSIHVTPSDKTSWTNKYDKPESGIPKTDLEQSVQDILSNSDLVFESEKEALEYINNSTVELKGKNIGVKENEIYLPFIVQKNGNTYSLEKVITNSTQEECTTSKDIEIKGVTLGNLNDGDVIPKGSTLDDIFTLIGQKEVNPTYTKPTVTLSVNGGTSTGTVETGSIVEFNVKSVFNKNDAGDLLKTELYKDDTLVVTDNLSTNPFTYKGENFVVTDGTTTIKSISYYDNGEIKKTNFGNDYPNGRILAGSKESNELKYIGARKLFYGTFSTGLPSFSSDLIRSSSASILNPSGTFDINFAVGKQSLFIAVPSGKSIKEIMYVEMNDTAMLNSFTTETIQVADARGGSEGLMDYTIYKYSFVGPIRAGLTFRITLN